MQINQTPQHYFKNNACKKNDQLSFTSGCIEHSISKEFIDKYGCVAQPQATAPVHLKNGLGIINSIRKVFQDAAKQVLNVQSQKLSFLQQLIISPKNIPA